MRTTAGNCLTYGLTMGLISNTSADISTGNATNEGGGTTT
jgi:hypothetical protein